MDLGGSRHDLGTSGVLQAIGVLVDLMFKEGDVMDGSRDISKGVQMAACHREASVRFLVPKPVESSAKEPELAEGAVG